MCDPLTAIVIVKIRVHSPRIGSLVTGNAAFGDHSVHDPGVVLFSRVGGPADEDPARLGELLMRRRQCPTSKHRYSGFAWSCSRRS